MTISTQEKEEIMRSLLHKEGSWVEWGRNCQKLQKAGINPSEIFEVTGFQASQQNLVIVASQVYDTLEKTGATEELLNYYRGPRSDVLYEFRILNQEERLQAAILAQEKKLDIDGAKEVARAIKEMSRLAQPPSGFTTHPGDAVAYQYWKSARQKKSLQDKARLIAEGLKFAHSHSAREQIEKLLTDFSTTTASKNAPLLPIYRLESDEELPVIIPVAGTFPLQKEDIENITNLEVEEPFRVVTVKNTGQLVPLPGWQVLLKAQQPLAIFCKTEELPKDIGGRSELVLVVVDKEVKEWDDNSYFLVAKEDKLEFQWFYEPPEFEILGQLILVLRPKRILDENNLLEPWQMDD
jgi:hypothetical protein